MARITEADVEAANDAIAQAASTGAAFDLIEATTATMRSRLLDLNHIDAVTSGRGDGAVMALGSAHGWSWSQRQDYVPADGLGPCLLGRFEPHSRSSWLCRICKRRPIDHRPVTA